MDECKDKLIACMRKVSIQNYVVFQNSFQVVPEQGHLQGLINNYVFASVRQIAEIWTDLWNKINVYVKISM